MMWLIADWTNVDKDKRVRLKCQAFNERIVHKKVRNGVYIAAAA